MSATLIAACTAKNGSSVATGQFYAVAGAGQSANATEAFRAVVARVAGTFSGLQVNINGVGVGRVYRFRKNAGNGSQSVSPTDSTSGVYSDTTNNDPVSSGDTFDISSTVTSSIPRIYSTRMVFQANTGHGTYYFAIGGAPAAAGTSVFINIVGSGGAGTSTTESAVAVRFGVAGTLANLQIYLSNNTCDGNIVFTSRIAGSGGTQTVTFAAGETGSKEDNTHTDAVSIGSDVCVKIDLTAATTGTITLQICGFTFTTTGRPKNDVFTQAQLVKAGGSGSTYLPITGESSGGANTVEFEAQIQHGFSGSCSNMRVYVGTNTLNGALTVSFRKNSTNGNQTITIPAATGNGWFEDTTSIDTFTDTDSVNIAITGAELLTGSCEILYTAMIDIPPAPVLSNSVINDEAAINVKRLASVNAEQLASVRGPAQIPNSSSALMKASALIPDDSLEAFRTTFTFNDSFSSAQKVSIGLYAESSQATGGFSTTFPLEELLSISRSSAIPEESRATITPATQIPIMFSGPLVCTQTFNLEHIMGVTEAITFANEQSLSVRANGLFVDSNSRSVSFGSSVPLASNATVFAPSLIPMTFLGPPVFATFGQSSFVLEHLITASRGGVIPAAINSSLLAASVESISPQADLIANAVIGLSIVGNQSSSSTKINVESSSSIISQTVIHELTINSVGIDVEMLLSIAQLSVAPTPNITNIIIVSAGETQYV